MPKKDLDLLGPLGQPEADYIRARLKGRLGLESDITMRRSRVQSFMKCLDSKATIARISQLHDEALAEVSSPVWQLELEPLLVDLNGAWRYEGRREVLSKDMAQGARFYAIAHTMDALLQECGFPVVRTRAERLDDAAWYAMPSSERG